jgi:hypothetical protein
VRINRQLVQLQIQLQIPNQNPSLRLTQIQNFKVRGVPSLVKKATIPVFPEPLQVETARNCGFE